MTDAQLLERIVVKPEVMAGKPTIRGTRLSVEYVLNLLAHGATFDGILQEYAGISRDDIQACILFATKTLESMAFMPVLAEST
jgi:uncharacterized protein (DUF433 family)